MEKEYSIVFVKPGNFVVRIVSCILRDCVVCNKADSLWLVGFTPYDQLISSSVCCFFFSGVWADRYSRKKLIIAADTMIAAFTCLLVLLIPRFTNTGIMMAALIVISFIRSVGAGVQTPAVAAMIPSLVPEDKLMKINGYNASIQSAVQFAAPAAAGLVLLFMPLSAVLMVDIVTAVIGVGIF